MTKIQLCSSQQSVVNAVVAVSEHVSLMHVHVPSGFGRTEVLLEIQRKIGGTLISMRDIVTASRSLHPLALEDALEAVVRDGFEKSPQVLIDDWQLLANTVEACSSYPRAGFLEVVCAAFTSMLAADSQRKLIIGSEYFSLPAHLERRAVSYGIHEFTPDDYRHLCREFGVPVEARIDIEKIHRFAPRLNAYQLKAVCASGHRDGNWTTDAFLDYLTDEHLVSNVKLPEVAEVRLEDLIGVDDLVEQLIANVVFPLENDELAQTYALRPKRGVLLLGPPGTGKTTIGKALAHRLRGKFFLIDGTVISGTDQFYYKIQELIHDAKNNAPAVVFIDDSDVIFENRQEHGFYRYLLTILDGLESQSLEGVCIMMTAMDLRHIPPALIRSGRVELWLETQLPDEAARAKHLLHLTRDLPAALADFDVNLVAKAADQCTPADLKRLVNDAKTAYAVAQHRGRPSGSFTANLLDAIKKLREMKQVYSAVRSSSDQKVDRPVWFDVSDGISI